MKNSQFWFNLAVRDVEKSRQFYQDIGFELNPQFAHSKDTSSLMVGKQRIVMMLFSETIFSNFVKTKVEDLDYGHEILFNLSADSREEVDALAKAVIEAGGKIFEPPAENQGWMYGMGFEDPDGHKWNVLFMDMAKFANS